MGKNEKESKKTYVNDILLVYEEDIPKFFARVEDISPDIKPDWFHIRLMVLVIPVQEVTWILKDIYINGAEFSMGGYKMRLEKIISPQPEQTKDTIKKENKDSSRGRVINFSNHKKTNDK